MTRHLDGSVAHGR